MFSGVTSGLLGHWWCRPHHSVHTPTPTLSFPSLPLSLSAPSPWQMAASQPATPAKACELKVIPSRFEELPESPWWGRRGGGVEGCSTHLPPRLGDIWLGLCGMERQPPPPPPPPRPRGIEAKLNKRAGVCQLIYVCICVGTGEKRS